MSRLHVPSMIAFVLVVVSAGCTVNEIDRVKLAPVAGRVINAKSGTPIPQGTVSFRPNAAKGNGSKFEPNSEIDSNGNYRLKTQGREGAPLGWYRLILACAEPIDPKNPYAPPKYLVNAKYATLETSGLEIEVVDNAPSGAYDLKLQP
jgi:hypothetical protein